MGTLETLAIVAAVYVLAFVAHRTTAGVGDRSASDEG